MNNDTNTMAREWPDPTAEMLASPEFEAIWQRIKKWDIHVPGAYVGYCGATGNHVRAILDALRAITYRASSMPSDEIKRLRSELFSLCEDTEERCASVAELTEGKEGAFARGRIHEAKGIRKAMGEVFRLSLIDTDQPTLTVPAHECAKCKYYLLKCLYCGRARPRTSLTSGE